MEITVTAVTVGRSYCWKHFPKPYFSFHMSLISLSNGFEICISYSLQTSAQIILFFKLLLFLYWHLSSGFSTPFTPLASELLLLKGCPLLESKGEDIHWSWVLTRGLREQEGSLFSGVQNHRRKHRFREKVVPVHIKNITSSFHHP